MHVEFIQPYTDPENDMDYLPGDMIEVAESKGQYLIFNGYAIVFLPNPDPAYVVDWKYENEKWRRIFGRGCRCTEAGELYQAGAFNEAQITTQYNAENMAYNAIIDIEVAEVPAGGEPVTLDEFKTYAVIDFNSNDEELAAFITAARMALEVYTNINFVSRKVTAWINNGAGGQLLPRGPVLRDDEGNINISVKDSEGLDISSITLAGGAFPNMEAPVGGIYKVEYSGGYAAGKLPEIFKAAIKAQALWYNEHKGDETDQALKRISPVAMQLMKPVRKKTNDVFIY